MQIFGPLSKVQPKFSEKIVGIKGDAGLSEMGISPADRETIKERVSITDSNTGCQTGRGQYCLKDKIKF